MEVIALAGGIAERGRADKVKLMRNVGGKRIVYVLNLSTIEGLKYADMIVQANDYIYINLTKTGANVYATDQNLQQILTNTADKVKAENYFIRPATERQVEKFLRRFE